MLAPDDNFDRVAIFVGAGASILEPTLLPSFASLRNEVILTLSRGIGSASLQGTLDSLTSKLASHSTKPELLFQVMRDYSPKINPVSVFGSAPPNLHHSYIAELCRRGVRVVITTNFDPCIERALSHLGLRYSVHPGIPRSSAECAALISALDSSSVTVWKPHGDAAQPDTLSFAMQDVARLATSAHLRNAFEHVLEWFDLLFLGYSGYDDDFFVFLRQWPARCAKTNRVLWNTYSPPDANSPPMLLQKAWGGESFKIWQGDMRGLLKQLLDGMQPPALQSQAGGFLWQPALEAALGEVAAETKVSILGQYLFRLGLPERYPVWRSGLSLPDLSSESRLRFSLNLTESDDTASLEQLYRLASAGRFHSIANVALVRLTDGYAWQHRVQEARASLRRYRGALREGLPAYLLPEYYMLCSNYLEAKHGDTARANYFRRAFQKAAAKLYRDMGRIIDFAGAISSYAGSLAQDDKIDQADLALLQDCLNVVRNYNLPAELAGLYHSLSNAANRLGEKGLTLRFAEAAEEYTNLCGELGLYTEDRFRELLAVVLHQKSFALDSLEDSVSCIKRAIALVEKIRDPREVSRSPQAWLGIFNSSLGKYYMRNSRYQEALNYAEQALGYHIAAGDIRSEGRTRLDIGIIFAAQKRRKEAMRELARSYQLLVKVGENTEGLLTVLEDLQIDLPSLIE